MRETNDTLRLIQTAAANCEFFFANQDFFYFAADGCVRRVRFPQTSEFSAANCGRLNEPLFGNASTLYTPKYTPIRQLVAELSNGVLTQECTHSGQSYKHFTIVIWGIFKSGTTLES